MYLNISLAEKKLTYFYQYSERSAGILVDWFVAILFFGGWGGKDFLFHRDLFRIGYIPNLYLASLKLNRHSHTPNPITWTSEICLL